MTRYVGLLRGINVGGVRIAMADLRELLTDSGFRDVRTVLATGNVLFDSDDPPDLVQTQAESVLAERYGYDAAIVLTDLPHIRRIVEACPFPCDQNTHHCYVVFFRDGQVPNTIKAWIEENQDALGPNGIEQICTDQGVVYWRCPKGASLSTPFATEAARRCYRSTTTIRNARTLGRLLA